MSFNTDNRMSFHELFEAFPSIFSERFLLTEVSLEDTADFLKIYGDEENAHFISHYIMKTEEEAQEYIKRLSQRFNAKDQIRWAIKDKSNGILVGLISLHTIDSWEKSAQIGYVVNRDYWGLGIATECVNAILSFIFRRTFIEIVEASISPSNKPSISFIKKLGFKKYRIRLGYSLNRKTGEYENRFFYRLTRKNFINL